MGAESVAMAHDGGSIACRLPFQAAAAWSEQEPSKENIQ
jgi:hypothetical protein